MGSRMIPLKAIMANGVEDNDNFSIRTVFEDYRSKCCTLKERPKNTTSGRNLWIGISIRS